MFALSPRRSPSSFRLCSCAALLCLLGLAAACQRVPQAPAQPSLESAGSDAAALRPGPTAPPLEPQARQALAPTLAPGVLPTEAPPEPTPAPTLANVEARMINRPTRTPLKLYEPAVEILPEQGNTLEGHAIVLHIHNLDKLTGRFGDPTRWLGWGAPAFALDPESGFWMVDINNRQPRLIHLSRVGKVLSSLPLSSNNILSMAAGPDSIWLLEAQNDGQVLLVQVDRQSGSETVYMIPAKWGYGLDGLGLSQEGEPLLERYGGIFFSRLDLSESTPSFQEIPAYISESRTYRMSSSEFCEACFINGYPFSDACGACIVQGPLLLNGRPVDIRDIEQNLYMRFLGAARDGVFYTAGRSAWQDIVVQKFSADGQQIGLARLPANFVDVMSYQNIRVRPDGEVYAMLALEGQDQVIVRLVFTPTLAALPTPTPAPEEEELPPGLPPLRPAAAEAAFQSPREQARQALIAFFSLLSERRYSEAASLYGGGTEQFTDLCTDNPQFCQEHLEDLQQAPHLFWQNACSLLLACLPLGEITEVEQVSAAEFRFWAIHVWEDGYRYTARGCCHAGDAALFRPVWLFPYIVKQIDGAYQVMSPPPLLE